MRVLVVPTSKHGGTAEIGRAIAETLRGKGIDVDVSQPEHMFDPAPYAAYIVGSGLYMGGWIDRAVTFVDDYGDVLQRKPTWLFSSGPLGAAKPQEPILQKAVDDLLSASGAREHRLFSGRLNLDRLDRKDRFIAKWVGAADGDFREWEEIQQWAEAIAEELNSSGTPAAEDTDQTSGPKR